jgi:hypothetical protein
LRHGLAVPIGRDPQYEPVITALTARIGGPRADEQRLALARTVAEVVIDLARIRHAQRRHITRAAELEHRIRPLLPDPRLNRYERQARSRRRAAIFAFDVDSDPGAKRGDYSKRTQSVE